MSKNLLNRIITSMILISIFFIIIFSHKYIFVLSILILGIIICVEANNMFSKLLKFESSKQNTFIKNFNFNFLFLNLITFCYVFFIFCYFLYEIYKIEKSIFLIYIFSICVFTDIGGYTFGKIIGGKKLTTISPNKTISGTIGSFIFCLIPLILFFNFNYLDLKFNLNNVLFSLMVSLTSQLGDLFISLIKRNANVKDTGKILPGHGGILDRVDGIIFAVPISYFLLKFI